MVAPSEKVYRYVADLNKHAEWNHGIIKITALTEGAARVGSQYNTEEGNPNAMPRGQQIMMSVMRPLMRIWYKIGKYTVAEITELKDNELVKWQAHLPNKAGEKLVQLFWEIELESDGNGTTHVTQRCQADPIGPFQAMVNEGWVKLNRAETTSNLTRLKSIVEA